MAKTKDVATQYLESLLSKIPEDKRAAVKEALNNDAALEDLGEHVLRQADYSRAMDEAKKIKASAEDHKARLDQWWGENNKRLVDGTAALKKLEELDQKRKTAAAADNGDDTITAALKKDLEGYVTRVDAEKALNEALARRDMQFANFTMTLNDLSMRHYIDFKERLNTEELFNRARQENKPLNVVYDEMSKDLREAKQKAEDEAKEKDLERRIREKVIAEQSARGPYPVPDMSEGVSPLSGLTRDGKKGDYLAEAIAEYGKSQAAR